MRISIDPPYIKLDALLKYAEILPSGGLVKILLQEGTVTQNGEKVTERRKKIYPGDRVEVSWPQEELQAVLEIETIKE